MQARLERSQALIESMCASLRARLERRVNRVPPTIRTTTINQVLAPASHAPTVVAVQEMVPRTMRVPKAADKKAQATRNMRNAPPTKKATSKPAQKPVTTTSASPPAGRRTATRAKKRSSDEMSSDNKENSPAPMPNKRVRGGVNPTKSAPTTRATRAASRQKPEQVLSPKNNNARQKPAKTNNRPR